MECTYAIPMEFNMTH